MAENDLPGGDWRGRGWARGQGPGEEDSQHGDHGDRLSEDMDQTEIPRTVQMRNRSKREDAERTLCLGPEAPCQAGDRELPSASRHARQGDGELPSASRLQ